MCIPGGVTLCSETIGLTGEGLTGEGFTSVTGPGLPTCTPGFPTCTPGFPTELSTGDPVTSDWTGDATEGVTLVDTGGLVGKETGEAGICVEGLEGAAGTLVGVPVGDVINEGRGAGGAIPPTNGQIIK